MRFYNIFFSPTGGTKKVADIVAKGTKLEAEKIDLIKEPDKLMKVKFEKKDLCLVAVPSYGGRIPSVVTDMFRKVKADGTKAILVAVFGNRMIDDTLLELQDVLEASGFVCIAGMEAVAEHSLMHQFGTGRPDQQDEKELLEFAAKIMQNSEAQRTPAFPGNRPYREYGGVPLKPVANGTCTSCGLCAKECPAGAIPLNNPKLTDKDKCISCMHCVAVCPKKARNCSKFISFIAGKKMKKVCSGRKETNCTYKSKVTGGEFMNMMFDLIFPVMFLLIFGMILFAFISGIRTWNKNNNSPPFNGGSQGGCQATEYDTSQRAGWRRHFRNSRVSYYHQHLLLCYF